MKMQLVEFECPKCGGSSYKTWGLLGTDLPMRFLYWFLFLFPGMFVVEIILGQRIPRRIFVCNCCELWLPDRSFLHCSECNMFHPRRNWSGKASLGNWFGLQCPNCSAMISCQWSAFSLLLLSITAPFWFFARKKIKLLVLHNKGGLSQEPSTSSEFGNKNVQSIARRFSAIVLVLSILAAASTFFWNQTISTFILIQGLLISVLGGPIVYFCYLPVLKRKGNHKNYLSVRQLLNNKTDGSEEDSAGPKSTQ